MPNESDFPVLIAGGGPTGLTAALELRRFGISVRIVDEMETPATTSRAVGIQARTLEEMELRGLADEFLRLGNRAAGGDVYGGGKLLFRADFTRLQSRYNFLLFLSQTETERILREALEAEGAAVEWGVKMTAFGQDSTGVTALLEHTDGSQEKVNASYFIDAEGAHSTIRTSLGLDFKGKTFNGNYALGDVHIDSSLVNSDFHIFASEHGFLGLFPMGGSHFRLIASDPPTQESTAAPPTLEELQAFYDQRSHIPARLRQLTWSSWFHINSRIVDNFRIGRAFMAGDAAHIHSPAGAQGMNTGIQDAINLGWKLALVLQGKAPETLLDTYQQDRLPVMRSIVANTERMTEITGGDHPILRSFFVNMAPWIAGADFVQQNATARISQIATNYRNSPLSADHFAEGSLLAGDRVPDVSVSVAGSQGQIESRRLFSLLDPTRFTLLLSNFADSSSVPAQISQSLAPWQDLIAIIQIGAAEANTAKPFQDCFGLAPSITLVRPDAYIGFRGSLSSISKLPEYCNLWLTPAAGQQAA